MRVFGLAFVTLVGCTPASPPAPAPAPSSAPAAAAAAASAPSPARALDAAVRGDYRACAQELRAVAEAAERATPVDAAAVSAREALAWLAWQRGDLAAAAAELTAAERALEGSALMGNMSAKTRVELAWQRAFMLREAGAPEAARARTAYVERAETIGEHAAVAALDAFFAVRAGDRAAALEAARRPATREDSEPAHLYALALAFDLGGDEAGSRAARDSLKAVPDSVVKRVVSAKLEPR